MGKALVGLLWVSYRMQPDTELKPDGSIDTVYFVQKVRG